MNVDYREVKVQSIAIIIILALIMISLPHNGQKGNQDPLISQDNFIIAQSLDDWNYRKVHTINAGAGAGTNYQLRISVHFGSGSDTGDEVYLNSHCRTDFGDVRFVASDGTTPLDFWMESFTISNQAVFWVEVQDSLDTDQTIYVYYGNDVATTTSNGDDTFIFFDDFDGSVIDTAKWNVTHGTEGDDFEVANGYIEFLDAADERANIITYDADSWTGNIALHWNMYWESTWEIIAMGMTEPNPDGLVSGADDHAIFETRVTDAVIVEDDGGAQHDDAYTPTSGVWNTLAIYYYSSSHMEIYDNGVEQFDYTTGLPNENQHPIFSTYNLDPNNRFQVTWTFVRNLVSSEPSHGTWGAEEFLGTTGPTSGTTGPTSGTATPPPVDMLNIILIGGGAIAAVIIVLGVISARRKTRKDKPAAAVEEPSQAVEKEPSKTPKDPKTREELILGALKSYPRITIEELSQVVGIAQDEVRRTTLRLVANDRITGTFNRTNDEFVSASATQIGRETRIDKEGVVEVPSCPKCGAPLLKILGPGETTTCSSCNTKLTG